MKKIFLFLILITLVGCINNPYRENYQSWNIYEEKPFVEEKDIKIVKLDNLLEEKENVNDFIEKFYKEGYGGLGFSTFREENLDEYDIKKFAKEIGADLVIYSQTYLGERSYQDVISMPVFSSTSSNGSFYNYNLGSTYYSGNSYTTSTQYIPITRKMYLYQYESAFFKKLTEEEIGYGVITFDIEDVKERFKINGNISEGIVVVAVVRGSQAYKDGFLRGDIIRKIGKKKIINMSSLENIELFSSERDIIYEILRNGKIKKIKVSKIK